MTEHDFPFSADLQQRRQQHMDWVRSVRDPAKLNSEGVRRIATDGAVAEYEIAPLPDGRFAIRCSIRFECGINHGFGSPWTAFPSRESCIDAFLQNARHHFQSDIDRKNLNPNQRKVANNMLAELNDGLFGFIEPDVSSE